MVAGNPSRSTYNASNFADQAVSFVCLGTYCIYSDGTTC